MASNRLPEKQHQKKSEIITKAVSRAADYWGLTNSQLGRILGLSDATISRMKDSRYCLTQHSKTWQLAMLFLRAFRGIDAYMGGRVSNEKKWLLANNTALNGVPLVLMQDVEGLAGVLQYIDCMRGQ